MSFASKIKGALPRAWAVLKDVHANLTPSQRRKVYGVATMAGVALAAKLGVEADTLFEWVAFAATIFSGVVAPAIARSKVDD